MSPVAYFITHPNVVINRDTPVTQWPLSELGRARMHKCLNQPWLTEVTSIYSSTEQKSVDGAQILAEHLSLPFVQVAELGENDRSSTGFLSPSEFELVTNEFGGHPGALATVFLMVDDEDIAATSRTWVNSVAPRC